MGDLPRLELLTGLQSLFHSRDYSDLVVHDRNGSRHGLHRAVVCPRSEYFRQAVQDKNWQDGKEGQIAMQEEDPEILAYVIEYLYLLDYRPRAITPQDNADESEENEDGISVRTDAADYGTVYGTSAVSAFGGPGPLSHSSLPLTGGLQRSRTEMNRSALTVHAIPNSGFENFRRPGHTSISSAVSTSSRPTPSPLATTEPNLILHAHMFAAGARYGIDGLKALSLDKYKLQLTRHWNSAEFAESIRVVYESTPSNERDMREAVGDTLTWHSRLLEKSDIETVVCDINGLAYELLKRSRRTQPEYHE